MQVWVNLPRVLGCLSDNTRTTAWFVLCTNLNSLYPLGIVKGSQKRQRQTWRKYPINLQDISCEAPVRTANDVTLCASMSKCHNKLLHIIQCFYLMMIALCVGCMISSLRFSCCGSGSMVIKSAWGGEWIRKQNCVQGCNCTGFIIPAKEGIWTLKTWRPQPALPQPQSHPIVKWYTYSSDILFKPECLC